MPNMPDDRDTRHPYIRGGSQERPRPTEPRTAGEARKQMREAVKKGRLDELIGDPFADK